MKNGNQSAIPLLKVDRVEGEVCNWSEGGFTKREEMALRFAVALTVEYVKQPTPALIEMVMSRSVQMADELLKQLEQ